MTEIYKAELQPTWRLLSEETPPLNTKCLFLSRWGTAQVAQYNPEFGFVAWCPLPALLPAQREKLNAEEKIRYAANINKKSTV